MSSISVLNYQEGVEQLAKIAVRRDLIPFFGAGFTCNCQACGGAVPDTKRAMVQMRDLVLDSTENFAPNMLDKVDFLNLAEIFFEYVPVKKRAEYFERNYTEVKLYRNQKAFLEKPNWPYAYTLNVDDGIEKNSDFTPIMPYRPFKRPRTTKKILYKLHGDALYESTYLDGAENIVFSQKQYMQAITAEYNTDIYAALLSDYGQKHILFIGCSLQDEQDLQYVYEKSKIYQHSTFRIVLRDKHPDIMEEQHLKKHGINEIIMVDSYERFYDDFLDKYAELQKDRREVLYEHLNPTEEAVDDRHRVLELIAGKTIFDVEGNKFLKSNLHIRRNVVNEISEALDEESIVLLKGRRFSGKTYVLCSLNEKYKTKDRIYFPSTSFADEDVVEKLMTTEKNSLFLFDSNSLTPDVYSLILNLIERLKEQKNQLVMAVNSNDDFILSRVKCPMIELNSKFVETEIDLSGKALDSFGLTRRKYNQTNIDFLYILANGQNIQIPFTQQEKISFNLVERSVLIALSALDKLYYSDLIALNFPQRDVGILCKKMTPFIEIVPTGENETTRHSSLKLVHNSKIALIELLKDFKVEEISESIIYIVKKYRLDYSRRRLYIEVILFDTLSQLFRDRKNLKNLIATIYENLQPLLENDLHYWLQRAKSIYRTNSSEKALEEAYSYAKKAYLDGKLDLKTKAALTSALISCAIGEKVSFRSVEYYENTVNLSHEAVFSEYFRINPNYLATELPIERNTNSKRRIRKACNYVIEHSLDEQCIERAHEVLQKLGGVTR